MKQLSIEKIIETNNWYQRYCGAQNELAERDISCDWDACLNEIRDICKELLIEDKFDWKVLKKRLENGETDVHDDILFIEDKIGYLLNDLIYGYIYGGKNGN